MRSALWERRRRRSSLPSFISKSGLGTTRKLKGLNYKFTELFSYLEIISPNYISQILQQEL